MARATISVLMLSPRGYRNYFGGARRVSQRIQKDDGTGFRPQRPHLHHQRRRGGVVVSGFLHDYSRASDTKRGNSDSVKEEIQELLRGIAVEDPSFKYDVRNTFDCSYEISLDHPFMALVEQTVESVVGRKPAVTRENYWTDCALIGDVGSLLFLLLGPHGEGLHSMEEFANIDSLEQTTQVLTRIAKEFCE